MSATFPGTTVEALTMEKGSSRVLFDGIFATGGITLSQLAIMTGLEPYMLQNWIKRGFLAPPVKRVYGRQHLARAIIINMLREVLQLERICELIRAMSLGDMCIGDDELYHTYVDLLAEQGIDFMDPASVSAAVQRVTGLFSDFDASAKKRLARILQVMLYAHIASGFRDTAVEILSTLQ